MLCCCLLICVVNLCLSRLNLVLHNLCLRLRIVMLNAVVVMLRHKNTWHAFVTIARDGGVPGLWKGWVPNVQRAALVNLGG